MTSTTAFELDRAVVRYAGTGTPQLVDATFRVGAGECVALVGPNGAGKTTALRALLAMVPLAGGAARVFGRDAAAWDRAALARQVGVVGQREEPAFPVSVGETVAMGRYAHLGPWGRPGRVDREAVARALRLADVEDFADRWVQTLSGGEWQRVRLARALAQEPRALVLDEPTSSLDLRHEMELLEAVLALVRDRGLAALIVSHHINAAARFAGRLVLFDRGAVVADDVPARVLTAERLSGVFGWPVAVHATPDGAPQIHPLRRPARTDP